MEELFYKEQRDGMTKSQNLIVTFILITINCTLALFIPNIGAAMTLVGSSINPVIGFILPVVFYWKLLEGKPWYNIEKIKGMLNVVVIIVVSVMSLIKFFSDLTNPDDDDAHCYD